MPSKALRDRIGIVPGEVEVEVGAELRIAPLATDELAEEDGEVMLPRTGVRVTAEMVRELRFADQR